MSHLSEKIRSKAIKLGFDKVGITKADSITKQKNDLERWISNDGHASLKWIAD